MNNFTCNNPQKITEESELTYTEKRYEGRRTVFKKNRPFNGLDTDAQDIYPFYSVVLPTYNRSHNIINTLNSLIKQTIPKNKYEIIIVNDGSTDNTEEVILNLKSQNSKPEIRYFKIKNGGPAKARNFGIKQSRGEIIFFTDDDCIVPNNWMETLLSNLNRYPEVAGVGGWCLPPEDNNGVSFNFWQKHYVRYVTYTTLNYSFGGQYEILSNDPLFCLVGFWAYNTANICYKKEVLQKVGGFREDFYWPGAEDNELAFRITVTGYSLLYIPFYVTDCNIRNFSEFIKVSFRRGANNYLLRKIHYYTLENLKPGFAGEFGTIKSFLNNPFFYHSHEKMFFFLDWISLNAGIIYVKNKSTNN